MKLFYWKLLLCYRQIIRKKNKSLCLFFHKYLLQSSYLNFVLCFNEIIYQSTFACPVWHWKYKINSVDEPRSFSWPPATYSSSLLPTNLCKNATLYNNEIIIPVLASLSQPHKRILSSLKVNITVVFSKRASKHEIFIKASILFVIIEE